MDFVDQIKQFSSRVEKMKNGIQTEEATKTSLIMPFFSILGYDVFNPDEFVPEFTADVGIKKGEKVDYAIMKDGEPIILIEAKWCGEDLSKHDSQLFRYFGTTDAKFAILTNGIIYRFYTEVDAPNKMDETPFLTIDMLNIRDNQVAELKKFTKAAFDIDAIFNTASELKYSNEFKKILADELQNPTDDFVKYFLASTYTGMKTQNVIDKFRPILKKALNNYVSELMSDKIQSALNNSVEKAQAAEETESTEIETQKERAIVTTDEELEAYFIVKNLLKDLAPISDFAYRDTIYYFNILYQDNARKWICRLTLTETQKVLMLPDEDKNIIKYTLESIYDLEKYKEELASVLKRYL